MANNNSKATTKAIIGVASINPTPMSIVVKMEFFASGCRAIPSKARETALELPNPAVKAATLTINPTAITETTFRRSVPSSIVNLQTPRPGPACLFRLQQQKLLHPPGEDRDRFGMGLFCFHPFFHR